MSLHELIIPLAGLLKILLENLFYAIYTTYPSVFLTSLDTYYDMLILHYWQGAMCAARVLLTFISERFYL